MPAGPLVPFVPFVTANGGTPSAWSALPGLLVGSGLLAAFVVPRGHPRFSPASRPALTALTVFVAAVGVAHILGRLSGAGVGGWLTGTGELAAAAVAAAALFILLRRLPHAPESRDRAEELERLRLLEAAVDACGDGVLVAETRGADARPWIVYTNPAFEHITGYEDGEAVGQSPSILRDDEADKAVLDAIRASMRAGGPVRTEQPARRKDGSRLWAEWQVVPVAGPDGEARHWVAVLRDTTGRRAAEQAVCESEARFRGLFEQAADGILVLDSAGRVVDANGRACESLGYTHGELTARTADDLDTSGGGLSLRPGDSVTADTLFRRKDGTTFPVEVRLAALEVGGRPHRLALVRDITARRQAERALREREEFLRALIAHIPCGVFWKDQESVVRGCNDRFARDRGFGSSADVVGREFPVAPAEAEAALARDRRVMETGEPLLGVEETLARPTGTAVLLTSTVPMRDAAGRVVGVLGVSKDVTDHKRLEDHLRQKQKLEAVGQFAGGVAHDFNNLLTVISGNAELLRPVVPADSSDLLDDLGRAADRAAELVRQLLAFSRRQPVRPETLDLNEVVADLGRMLRRLLGERVAVEAVPAACPVTVRADRGQVEQVVVNLAVNAKDAMPDGGTLTIRTEPAGGSGGPCYGRLVVSDTGTGMTDEVRARAFEPFFTTKGPDKGTGLGLASVYGIVDQSGGRIDLDSAPGRGTTLRIDLPWSADVPSAPRPTTTPPPRGAGGRTVLLVEDEAAVRKLTRHGLERHGYAVAEAGDAEAALAVVRAGGVPDLLVTDLTMPGMGGRELAARVRASRPGVGVVFVSGYAADAAQLASVPGAVFLPKPFTPADLLLAVERTRLGL